MTLNESTRIVNCKREFTVWTRAEGDENLPMGVFMATCAWSMCLECEELQGEIIDPEKSWMWPCTYEEAYLTRQGEDSPIYCHRVDCEQNTGLPEKVKNAYGAAFE